MMLRKIRDIYQLLSAMGVLSGDGNGNFNPNREMTRAESIIMIYNYLTR